jgi:hypothetical protein
MIKMSKAKELKTEKYTIQVNYSDEAKEKKLMKFIPVDGEFEISAEDMISFLVNQVSMKELEPTFVDTEKINIVSVHRQIKANLNRDYKKGEEIRMEYVHPYPLEYALLEQIYGIASLEEGVKYLELTNEKIEEIKKKITPEMEEFTKNFYKSIKGLDALDSKSK